jgi:hypothetical protein
LPPERHDMVTGCLAVTVTVSIGLRVNQSRSIRAN